MSELALSDIINQNQDNNDPDDNSNEESNDFDFLTDWKSKFIALKQGVDKLCVTMGYTYCYGCNNAGENIIIQKCDMCLESCCNLCVSNNMCNQCKKYIENEHHIYLKVKPVPENINLIITSLNENFSTGLFYNYGVTTVNVLNNDKVLVLINLREGIDEDENTATIEEIQEDIEMFLNDAAIEIFNDIDGGVEII